MNRNGSKEKYLIRDFIMQKGWLEDVKTVDFLAEGEYNSNYRIKSSAGSTVFRINHGSQLGLQNQIEYEYGVLKLLEETGVTPKALFYDNGPGPFGGGVLLEEYIDGRPLDYRTDLGRAAEVFAKIHQVRNQGRLIVQENPFRDIAAESIRLLEKYPAVEYPEVYKLLRDYHDKMSGISEKSARLFDGEDLCIVNTEVNSLNFIVGKKGCYLIDWEKAVYSYRYQDLAHFLAATTTLWKSDILLTEEQKTLFLKSYASHAGISIDLAQHRERTALMERIIYLRALSWCYMAYYEYIHLPRPIKNKKTFKKIKEYLREAEWFLK